MYPGATINRDAPEYKRVRQALFQAHAKGRAIRRAFDKRYALPGMDTSPNTPNTGNTRAPSVLALNAVPNTDLTQSHRASGCYKKENANCVSSVSCVSTVPNTGPNTPPDYFDDQNHWESLATQQPPGQQPELESPAAGTLLDPLSALAHAESAPSSHTSASDEPVKRKPAPKTIPLIQHPDCRQCRHFRELSHTCVKVLIGIAHPTDPVCRGQHFQPKEVRS